MIISRKDIEQLPLYINGKSFKIIFKQRDKKFTQSSIVDYEVVIESRSIARAQLICDLIVCALCILDSSSYISIRDLAVKPIVESTEEIPFERKISSFYTPDIPLACKIAAKASFRRIYITAFFKYYLSCEMHSNFWIDLDPMHSPNIPISPYPYDHLRYGYAIILAYSIVEELNLAVNASNKKPSLINGEWNPQVKEDLEKRLKESNINIADTIVWQRRGSKKSLEIRRPPKIVDKTSWSYGNVRDCEIKIIDAINDISWVRSRIAAHKVDKDIRAISVYDVSNAQHLARRILLESLGFWRINEYSS